MLITSFIEYLDLEKKYAANTLTFYQKDLKEFQVFMANEFDLEDLSQVHYGLIRSWIVSLVDKGLNNKSINRKLSSLKSFYKFLLKTAVIDENPMAKHKALKTEKNVRWVFSEKEINQSIETFNSPDFERGPDRPIIELFYTTGIPRSELIKVRLVHIDFYKETLK